MTYDSNRKKATMKYIKEKQHRIEVRFIKDYYFDHIHPTIVKSGLPTATFIKQAILEKVEREKSKDSE